MSNVVAPSAFKTANVTFSAVKLLDSGGKQAYVNYSGAPLLMQVGSLETPFGMSVFDKVPGAPPKYSVELNLRGHDDPTNSPGVTSIYNALNSLDEFMVEQGVKNSKAWFKKDTVSKELIAELYTPSLRFAKDSSGARKPYPPTLKVQLRRKADVFDVEVYDTSNNLIKDTPLEDVLVKRANLTVLMKCTGVWFAGGKFGTTWTTTQFRVDSQPAQIRGPAFRSEAPDIRAFVAKNLASSASSATSASHPYETEEAEDEEDAEEETVVAAVLPPKKAAVPAAAPKPSAFVEEAVAEPVPVPKKVVKKVVTKVAGK
jgi:hypothetical protein